MICKGKAEASRLCFLALNQAFHFFIEIGVHLCPEIPLKK